MSEQLLVSFKSVPEPLIRCGMPALLQPVGPRFPIPPDFRHLCFNLGPLPQCFKAGQYFGAKKEGSNRD